MEPNISEYTYGYVITDELIHNRHAGIIFAPTFLSSHREGLRGGGYDVRLDRVSGIPLFLQFKLSHYLRRHSAREIKNGTFDSPYYRMYLRTSRHSNQHMMLLDLESQGTVFYTAPAFHRPDELNDAYLNHEVVKKSIWLSPSSIGRFSDNKIHYVAFQLLGKTRICSKEPEILNKQVGFDQFIKNISSKIKESGQSALKAQNLEKLADFMSEISKKKREIDLEKKRETDKILRYREPIERIAFYSHVYFDCQLYIASLEPINVQPPE